MKAEITRYMKRADGSQNLGVALGDAVRILVEPASAAAQQEAEKAASAIVRDGEETARLEQQVIDLRAALKEARAARKHAEDSLDAALSGKRRFFGQVLLKPSIPGDWQGQVWLLDPEKQEKGWGLRFASLADVRREYPELWVVARTNDGILLDSSPVAR